MYTDNILLVLESHIMPISWDIWQRQVLRDAERIGAVLSGFGQDHRRLHLYLVQKMIETGQGIVVDTLAQELSLPARRVEVLLHELCSKGNCVQIGSNGTITGVRPVSITPTEHQVTFDDCTSIYAFSATDALAAPFIYGNLLGKEIRADLQTKCGHCQQKLSFSVDSRLESWTPANGHRSPLVFIPLYEIDSEAASEFFERYQKQNKFYCSEEHARQSHAGSHRLRGAFLSISQALYVARTHQVMGCPSKQRPVWHREIL